jgi:hypothetical protein
VAPAPPAPLPTWYREPKIEVVPPPLPAVPQRAPLAGSTEPGIPSTQKENPEPRPETILDRIQSWQSSSCLIVVAVMFGMGMLAEVAYEKIAPPRPTTHTVHRSTSTAKKHPSPRRVQ